MNENNSIFLEIYHKKLTGLKIPFKEKQVETSYGKTNIIICGSDKKPPLFLLHGLNSAAPFAIDTIDFLLEKHQIFAIDILGEPNKSDFVRMSKKDASYGKWLLEIINYFKLEKITLLGTSFGAFPILKALLIDESSVKEIFLISPSGIINGNLWKTITRFLIPMKKFQKTKNKKHLKICLDVLYDNFDNITLAYLKDVFLHFKIDFSVTPNFKTKELAYIKTPITIISSKNDFFVPALKLKKRSEKNFTSLKKFIILDKAKHIPSKSILENVFKEI